MKIVIDVILWILSVALFMTFRLLTDKLVLTRYLISYSVFFVFWLLLGLAIRKYSPLKRRSIKKSLLILLILTLLTSGVAVAEKIWYYPDLSIYFLLAPILLMFLFNLLILCVYYYYKYATNGDDVVITYTEREPIKCIQVAHPIDVSTQKSRIHLLLQESNSAAVEYLSSKVDLYSSNTLIQNVSNPLNVNMLESYLYDSYINMFLLNDIEDINKLFCSINEKMPDDGLFICRFKTKSLLKKEFLNRHPKGLNYIFYSFNFIYKRVLPKLLLTSKLYFDITKGKNQILSTTEVLGRLYYCGFVVVDKKKINGITYVVAQRKKSPETQEQKRYGLLIRLNRIGKDRQYFKVYKLRTMHAYSEYLQTYIYENNNLQEGGKFNHDIRITTLGRFARKYWIDELPMLINLFKGEMKLVGVRPLSNQYFNLYSKELQELRVQFKPGLLPPFYADLPKTLEEIQESELNYLKKCRDEGVFITDLHYFWKIIVNIIFRKARSK
ncbi:MAG: sugar transferase [Paludibacteraceae bacterium]|nr:sugar transferase [Paludibacteraceae bacterium]